MPATAPSRSAKAISAPWNMEKGGDSGPRSKGRLSCGLRRCLSLKFITTQLSAWPPRLFGSPCAQCWYINFEPSTQFHTENKWLSSAVLLSSSPIQHICKPQSCLARACSSAELIVIKWPPSARQR